MSAEVWKAVPGFEGLYEVSDHGRVRSLDRTIWCEGPVKGRYASRKPGRVMRPGPMTSGHLTVVLGRKAGSRCVHELVLLAFVGPRPTGMETRHLDGNEKNNALSNLEYATRSRNTQDKKWHRGARTYKLKPADVVEIRRGLLRGQKCSSLAEDFGVAASTIYAIRERKIHRDIP